MLPKQFKLPAQFEIGEYHTADGQQLNIYATYRRGGLNLYGHPVKPAYGFNLDVDGEGKLWFWTDWGVFVDRVNEIAGEVILTADDNPCILEKYRAIQISKQQEEQ